MKNYSKSILSVLAAGGLALTTSANTITPNAVLTPTPGVWAYGLIFSSGELHSGDGFTIFDFGGYVAGSIYAPGPFWTAAAVLVGSNPAGAPLGPDDPGLWNLQFTYVGPNIQSSANATPFGFFGATTTSSTIVTDDWISQDHLLGTVGVVGDGALGTIHRDQIQVPGAVVPDGGATVGLLGLALLGLGGLRRSLVAKKA